MTKIGVQAMMLKESFETEGVFETLEAVSDIGYHAVEISQVPMTPENVDALDRARTELGMDIGALSAMLTVPEGMPAESLTADFDKIVADCKRLDATMLRMGMLPFDAMFSLDAVLAFCDASEEMAQRLAGEGIGLYYHNHHIEFAKYDGRFLLDVIADRAPSMGLEIDVHWVQRGGLDPVRTLTANLALEMGYASGDHRAALFATGMILFLVVVILNGIAGLARGKRGRSGPR